MTTIPSATFTVLKDSDASTEISTYLDSVLVPYTTASLSTFKPSTYPDEPAVTSYTTFNVPILSRHQEDAVIAIQRHLMGLGLSYSLFVGIG